MFERKSSFDVVSMATTSGKRNRQRTIFLGYIAISGPVLCTFLKTMTLIFRSLSLEH